MKNVDKSKIIKSFDGLSPREFAKNHQSMRRDLKKLLPRDKEYFSCKACEKSGDGTPKQCDGCKRGVFYCSMNCLKNDWKNHKANCGRLYKCEKVPNKGMGNVALRNIAKGEIICMERPVLSMTDNEYSNTLSTPELRKIYSSKFKQLSTTQQQDVMNLSFQLVEVEDCPKDKKFALFAGVLLDNLMNFARFDSNKRGLFLDCSRFNHSCYPNSEAFYSEPYLRVFAVRNIMEGEEICFTYHGDTLLAIKDLSKDTPPTIEAMKEEVKSKKAVMSFDCKCWLCTTDDQRRLQEINDYRIKFWKLGRKFYRTKALSQEYIQMCRELLEHINSGDTLHLSVTDFYARKGTMAAMLTKNSNQVKFFIEEYHKAKVIRRGEDTVSAKDTEHVNILANMEGLFDSLPEVENASFYKEFLKKMHQ